jgi:hypothetical protein
MSYVFINCRTSFYNPSLKLKIGVAMVAERVSHTLDKNSA